MARPPVCKIMDYGRFKYESKKKASEARKKQFIVKLKEIKLRPRTDEHDYGVKLRNARDFLEQGHKVKVTIIFRGREMAHREIGQKQLEEMAGDLKEVGVVEQAPRMEGRSMFMIIGATPKARAAARSGASAPAGQASPPAQSRPPRSERPADSARPAAGAAPSPARPAYRGPTSAPAKPAPAASPDASKS